MYREKLNSNNNNRKTLRHISQVAFNVRVVILLLE